MRLDKYIASVTDYSRTEVKRLLKQGEITINDCIVSNPAQHIKETQDIVCLDGNVLTQLAPRYFMLNKPKNTVCATEDSEHPTVIDLLNEPNSHQLQIAGRLDKDTTGLVLITDNGQWNHQITAPNKQHFKTYRVTLAEALSDHAIQQLIQGILLKNEKRPTLPAKIVLINDTQIELSIQEGKYHQIKRMMAAVGGHVVELHRQQIAHIILDSSLALGEYRPLTLTEIALV
jgi:16S rRNA pseudouridine516 synthase